VSLSPIPASTPNRDNCEIGRRAPSWLHGSWCRHFLRPTRVRLRAIRDMGSHDAEVGSSRFGSHGSGHMSCMDAARLRRLIGNSERVMERARDAELASAKRVNSSRGALEESRARLRRHSAGRQRESPPPSIVTFTM
jgi:hypothetical protein